jgi:hypothetical protein
MTAFDKLAFQPEPSARAPCTNIRFLAGAASNDGAPSRMVIKLAFNRARAG